jgi:hypothetical protein
MTESSKQRPPREFWVCSKKMEAGGFFYAEEKEMQPDLYPHYIHVIEASYANELEAKLAVAVKALEQIARGEYTDGPTYDLATSALEQLKAGLE